MRFQVVGRKIEQKELYVIGLQGDNKVETLEFVLPRYYNGIDLSEGIAFLLFQIDKTEGFFELYTTVEDENIVLTWLIGKEATQSRGILKAQLKISGVDDRLWQSEITSFTVGQSILVDTPQPVTYYSRAALSRMGDQPAAVNASASPRIAEPNAEPPITVVERTMMIPSELQNIAVQNDQNSETVTIKMPRRFDGKDLLPYKFWLRTTNSEGGYDPVPLAPTATDNQLTMLWTLKPPQTSYSGKLSIQLWVTGDNFDWQTAEASVNIINQIGGEPVIPVTPPVMDEFLKQISKIAEDAKNHELGAEQHATNAANSATAADNSAKQAATSAANAKASEESAKKSETSASGSLTDINTGLAGKFSIAEANSLIKSVNLDEPTGVFVFTRYDGTTFSIDTAIEKAVVNFRYDPDTNELVLELVDGQEQRIDMTAFTNVYEGAETGTIQVTVSGSVISASVKGNSVAMNLLTPELQEIINNKITANVIGNASQVKFADGDTMQEKLDSGALNGTDGVNVAINGMFYMRVNEFGHLMAGVADGAEPPPVSVKNGHLIYTIE